MSASIIKKEPDREDLEAQIRVIRDDVTTLTGLLRDMAESKTSEARDAAMERAQGILDSSGRAIRSTRASAEHGAETLEGYVAEKPLQSTMIALGLGIVLGWMSRR